MNDALAWAGTFHGIGARLLRDYADQIGLDPSKSRKAGRITPQSVTRANSNSSV